MTDTTVADLRAKIDALEGTQIELIAERDEISFAAVVERNKKAAGRVAEINAALLVMQSEEATLKAALAEAQRRALAADAAERDATKREKAQKAIALLESFSKRGAALDAKFDEAIAEFNAMSAEFRQLDALGYAPTTHALVASNMKLALKTKVMSTGMHVEHLAPHMRRNFITVVDGWVSHVKARADALLNTKTAAEAA
jgi:hypothetical protein